MLSSYFQQIRRASLATTLTFLSTMPFSLAASASELTFLINDFKQKPITNVVITVTPLFSKPELEMQVQIIDQIKKEYVPHVLIITQGSSVNFPNKDNIRHHVYSFSDAKQFELPLYKGEATDPVLFEKLGVVALGCNIHDWMRGYIYVTDTPFAALTNDKGKAQITGLVEGGYQIKLWHPRQKSSFEAIEIQISNESFKELKFELELKPKIKKRKKRKGRYR